MRCPGSHSSAGEVRRELTEGLTRVGVPGTRHSMRVSTEVREHFVGLRRARSALGLDQKVQAGEKPEKGLEKGQTRSSRARSTGTRSHWVGSGKSATSFKRGKILAALLFKK